jgi:hypothetical protein
MYIEPSELGSSGPIQAAQKSETSDLWWSDLDQYLDTSAGQRWMDDMAEVAESAAYGWGI